MTILTKPYMQTGNAHLLPIDRNDPSLVLYLPLWYPHGDMTGSTIYSYDKNRRTGTVSGAVWGSTGRFFDHSNDTVTIPNTASLQLTGDMTVIAWVQPDSNSDDYDGIVIKSNQSPTITGWELLLRSAAVGFYFVIGNGVAQKTAYGTGGAAIAAGTWYQLVGVRSGTTNSLYINLVKGTDGTSGTLVDSGTNVVAGLRTGQAWGGKIGEICIYNRALPVGEITRNHQATKWRYL